MALLPNGLETLEIGVVTWREILNGNFTKLDQRCILSGTLAARPVFGSSPRFYYATNTGQLFYDSGASWVLVSGAAPAATVAVLFLGNVQVTSGGNDKIWQKRVYFPNGAAIRAAQVTGCDGVDPLKSAGDLTVIHVSDTNWQQGGSPAGFDVELPGDAADAREQPGSPLVIGAGSYVHIFITQNAGNHAGPKLLLELE